ncbi:MAG TPA: hypothetical protein H9784_09665 [Candidatus Desulfovibrio intestinavium]|uniref:Uncharacterized protein n=1 Tax=Candidatus Desulfovibrio intestinavium TaxID=2838534 RepID=A0A9D2KQI2_9BACT|nr:hypothetical protein [Candidatus Desulfovibrio intestinavium]
MTVLTILIVIALVASVLWGCMAFNAHCDRKFSYRFFTQASFAITAVAVLLIYGGHAWYASAAAAQGDTLNGIILMGLGGLAGLGLLRYNVKRTNLPYGLGGSVLQLGLYAPLLYVGLFFLILALAVSFFLLLGVRPVYIINR